nr:MAG TPA: hypothetical protein [Caudoviricetes sp.]
MSGIMRAPEAYNRYSIPYSGNPAIGDSVIAVDDGGVISVAAWYTTAGWQISPVGVSGITDENNTLDVIFAASWGNKAAFIPGPNH